MTRFEAMGRTAAGSTMFVPGRYLEDPEALNEAAHGVAHRIQELEVEGDWAGVRETALGMIHRGEDFVRVLLRGRSVLNEVEDVAGGLQTSLRFLSGDANVPDIDAIRDGLRPALYPERIVRQRDLAIWYVVSGYTMFWYGASGVRDRHLDPVEHSPEALRRIEDEVEAVRGDAVERFQALYAALAGADWSGLEAASWRAASYPMEALTDLDAVSQTLREGRKYEGGTEGGAAGQAAAFARAEMEVHRLVRILALLMGAGYRFLFVARKAGSDEESRDAVEAARKKSFPSLVRDGLNVDLDDLVDQAGKFDGEFVEVEGFAENVRYVTGNGNVTRFDLVDRLHDRRVKVFYPYRDLTSWHLHDDAFVRVNGDFVADSEHTGGPELQVDTVNVGAHGDDSWFDAMVHDFERRDIFSLYPSRGNLFWSPEPHHGHGADPGGGGA